jgi:exonuclease VII large subunit
VRDNRGRWRIEAEDLDAWLAAQTPTQASTMLSELLAVQHTPDDEQTHQLLTTEVAVLRARLEAFEGRAAELERDRDEARSERDRWRQMAERLSEGTHLPPSVPKPSGGFLARLLGRT